MYLCQEEWKDINGHVGLYQISNHGRIKSFAGNKDGIILSLKNSKASRRIQMGIRREGV